jgi:hypothetical protein
MARNRDFPVAERSGKEKCIWVLFFKPHASCRFSHFQGEKMPYLINEPKAE